MTLTAFIDTPVSSDQTPSTGAAINYGADNVTVTIAAGTTAVSRDDAAIDGFSFRAGCAVINNGNILSAANAAVRFLGSNGSVINNAGHNITGLIGITLDGDNETVTNHGAVSGFQRTGIFLSTNSNHVVLNNDGDIFGRGSGIEVFSLLGGGTINNSGAIRSDHFGIDVASNAGLVTIIDNGGTIAGSEYAIFTTFAGAISLNNHGTLDGGIKCDAANENDVVVNRGKILGEVRLGSGNDSFNGRGGSSGIIYGGDGNDTLKGGSHKEVLIGGLDKDQLTGGAAADLFVFGAVLDSVQGVNHDSILDFRHAQHDKIDLHLIDANNFVGGDQAFRFIGAKAFSLEAGELRYAHHLLQADTDGNGSADIEIHVNAAHLVKGDFGL